MFGDYNPSGKLPITFYKDTTQLADFENYSMKGRTYRFMADPLFQFGFGLSYTTFVIGDAKLDKAILHTGDHLQMTIPVSNKGKRSGSETVQVYVKKTNDGDGPLKTLRAFKKINVPAGASSNAVIDLPYTAFEFYDAATGKMTVAKGEYELMYGNSSAAGDLKSVSVTVK